MIAHQLYSMTYRRDSDAFAPYGITVPKSNASWFNYRHLDDAMKSKKRAVAWLVNNCRATSNRQAYVKELQKYIDVDIYGACGPFNCARKAWGIQPCWKEIEAKYFFYLSFENSLCRDASVNLKAGVVLKCFSFSKTIHSL